MDNIKLLEFATDAGRLMLVSGAETSRVEDTMSRILSKSNATTIEAMSLNTFIIGSIINTGQPPLTLVKRVGNNHVNFEHICKINNISRDFVSEKISLDEAVEQLDNINSLPSFSSFTKILAHGCACGGFTLVLSGTFIDSIISFIFGIILGLLLILADKKNLPYFFVHLIGGMFAGIGATLLHKIIPMPDMVIIGTITPLLPGRVMTNSIRDMLEGNFICGSTKLLEALLVGFAIAGGVGFGVSVGNGILFNIL